MKNPISKAKSMCSIDEIAYKLVSALIEPHASIHKFHLGNVNISDFLLMILFLLISPTWK